MLTCSRNVLVTYVVKHHLKIIIFLILTWLSNFFLVRQSFYGTFVIGHATLNESSFKNTSTENSVQRTVNSEQCTVNSVQWTGYRPLNILSFRKFGGCSGSNSSIPLHKHKTVSCSCHGYKVSEQTWFPENGRSMSIKW